MNSIIKNHDYNQIIQNLKQEAYTLGYKVFNSNGTIEIDVINKFIRVRLNEHTLEMIYAFCHELGHAREKNPDVKRYKTDKLYRIRTEILAYVLGFMYIRKYNLSKIGYIKDSFKHLKTYIIRRK